MEHGHEKIFDAAYMTHSLLVTGEVNHPLELSVQDLTGMEMTEVRNVMMTCGSGRPEGVIQSYRGMRLTEILNLADVVKRTHTSPSALYVAVSSSDGRGALLSYQELFNTAIGEQAIVIIEKDGKPLGADEGCFAFISASDVRTGPRRLRYLRRIQVHEHCWTPEM